ncbi:MAG: matrixin family metalloprotease [Planctomycetaceae bacterium]|nr:matrixin family metalloprotease [Planctomycetaceae bacterium]
MNHETAAKLFGKHLLPNDEVVSKLFGWGYFPDLTTAAEALEKVAPARLAEAIRMYQKMHGLLADGWIGPKTASKIQNLHRCGMPDFIGTADCKWPMARVTYLPKLTLPGLSDADVQRAFDEACAQWSAVCGVQLVRVAAEPANIVSRSGTGKENQLDGRGGTLAWSFMPCNAKPNTTLQQMYDRAEKWSYMMAVAVICHEIGHAIGLPHFEAGCLMAPYYDPSITGPQARDIEEAVRRYGKPKPAAGDELPVTLVINGITYSRTLTA